MFRNSEVASAAGMRESAAVIAVTTAGGMSSAGIAVHMRDTACFAGEALIRNGKLHTVLNDVVVGFFLDADVFVLALHHKDGDRTDRGTEQSC